MVSETQSPRRPGRPPRDAGSDVRDRLLDAATDLARERGFAAIGIRAIAQRAGVTPGMIAYYFGDKQGLAQAMLERVYAHLFERLRAVEAETFAGTDDPLDAVVGLVASTLASEPWIPPLIVGEVVLRDTPLRAFFTERLREGPARVIPALIERGVEAGQLRGDLDPRLVLTSLIGMLVFPYLAAPVLGPVLGFELDDAFRDRLTAHVRGLLHSGLHARGEASA